MSIFKRKNLNSLLSKNGAKLLDSLSEEILVLDKNYKIIYANKRFLENRERALPQIKGRFCYEVSHNLDKPCHMLDEVCPLNEALKGSSPIKVYHPHKSKEGERYLEINVSPLKDKKGEIIGIVELFRDITEQKDSEAELKELRDYLTNIINSSQIAITVIDNEGNFSIFNQGAERLTGYKAEEVIGKKRVSDFYVNKKELEYIQNKLSEEGLVEKFEASLLKKDESKVQVSISVSLLKNQEGITIGSMGISTDISDRKKAEKEVREQFEYLQTIYQLIGSLNQAEAIEDIYKETLNSLERALKADKSAILLFDPDGVMRFKAWKGLSEGYRKAVEGHSPWSKDEKNPQPIFISNVEEEPSLERLLPIILKEGIRALGFIPLFNRDRLLGKFMIYYNRLHLFNEYEARLLQAIASHIAFAIERKKAERTLRESEERLYAMINNTPNVAIESYDIEGRVLYWNKAAEKIFGWTRSEAIGKTLDQLILDKESTDEFVIRLREIDKSNKPFGPSEWRCKSKEGKEITVYSTIFPILSLGDRKEFICMDVEITKRKQAEESLQKSEEKYRFLYEKSPTVNLVIGIDGMIKNINERLLGKVGYSKEEVVGRNALEFVLPEQREKVASVLEKDFKGEHSPEIDVDIYAKDGSVHTILFSPGSVRLYEEDQTTSILITGIDVTERKKTEAEIRYLKEFNQEIVEKLPLGVLRLDKEGKIVYENPKMGEIMGVEKGENSQALGQKIIQMPNVIESGAVKSLENLLAGTPFTYLVIPFVSLYGKKTILSVNGVPLFDSTGNPDGALLLIEDITESKKIEQEIIRANKELSALNTIASIANQSLNLEVILNETLDKVLEVTDCQAGGVYILNQTTQELELKTCQGLSAEAVKEVDTLKIGEGFSGEIAQTGEPIMVEDILQDPRLTRSVMKKEGLHSYLGVPLKSKGKILGTLFVITKEKRKFEIQEIQLLLSIGNQTGIAVENAFLFKEAEQWIVQLDAIRNITNRLNKLNDVKTVAFSVVEEIKKVIEFDNCRVFLLNENQEELIPIAFGSEVEEYKGETEEVLRLKVGQGITGWVAQTGEPQIIDDGERHPRSRHVPGSPYVDESIIASPMIYEGEVRGVITLSKLGLKQFRQNHLVLLNILANEAVVAIENAKLYESLMQAYAKLKEAQEQLIQSEKLRALGEMAGGVAHDFNNLLGAVLGRAQLLLLSTQELETKRGLKVIEKAALDGAETVRRIQEFTRLRTDEDFIMVDLNEILKESLEITKHKWKDEAQKKGIFIQAETSLDEDLPQVMGNPSELREVFVNMILNSIDAMPTGGTLSLSSKLTEDHILASVTDTGIGMSEEVQKKVFDPFFTTKGPKGNGLGMSLAYGIVVRHNGEISIKSQEGKGSSFIVKLPRRRCEEKGSAQKRIKEEARVENILIIDDEPAIRELLCEILQSKGHKAMAVDNCPKGIELFKKENFDIVFTDLSMPEMTGWEVADQLKCLKPEVVIIMITGWGTQVDTRKLKAHSIDLLMAKPFEVKKLFEILSDAQRIRRKKEKKKLEKVTT